MSTEFSTSHGNQVIAAVQKQYPGVSIRPGKEISLDDHAKFRYDIPSEGYVRLDWHDQEFEDAWSFWIKRYSPTFLIVTPGEDSTSHVAFAMSFTYDANGNTLAKVDSSRHDDIRVGL
jgi:hypothetical protein